MPHALIALGSNLGERQQMLNQAVARLASTAGINSVRASAWHSCSAIGGAANQPQYLNGAAVVETSLAPEALLAAMQQIENDLGRDRQARWGPRTIDLDLLLFDQLVRRTTSLELPHPRMAFRRFVLEPAAEVASSMVHPAIGWTIAQLLHHLRTAPPYIAISDPTFGFPAPSAANQLATTAAAKTAWTLLEVSDGNTEKPHPDPPSLTLPSAIEFLRKQGTILARANWPQSSVGAISSFWIEDILAVGDVLWPAELQGAWNQLAAIVVPPKLLVAPSETMVFDNKLAGQVAKQMQRRASRQGIGPVLWLNLNNRAAAATELLAAIESMN